MKRFLHIIFGLGIAGQGSNFKIKSIRLNNQINFGFIIIMLALLFLLFIMSFIERSYSGKGFWRAMLFIAMALVNLLLSYKKFTNCSIILTIFLPPVIFMILPTLTGFVEEESFVYYPFIVIALSILPYLLLTPEKEKFIFWSSVVYYFVLLIFMDILLRYFSPADYIIIERIDTFYVYYKASHILIYLFILFSSSYFRNVNHRYEEELNTINIYLREQSDILSEKNQVLDNNRKELENKNKKLEKLRNELNQQNLELETAIKELKDAQDKLIQSEKLASLGVLTAGVAHEINNPLNYIAGGITMLELEMEGLFEKIDNVGVNTDFGDLKLNVSNSFVMIKEGVDRVVSIVESLKTYTTGSKSPRKLSDINKLLNSALKYLETKMDKDIHIIMNLGLNRHVPVFEEKLHQVLLNILDNGIYALRKSGNERKELFISTDVSEGYARISIFNNGPTIPKNHVLKIFDPFFTTKEPNEGTGLGMSISYNIIKEHRGRIELVNEQNKIGFNIFLPFD